MAFPIFLELTVCGADGEPCVPTSRRINLMQVQSMHSWIRKDGESLVRLNLAGMSVDVAESENRIELLAREAVAAGLWSEQ